MTPHKGAKLSERMKGVKKNNKQEEQHANENQLSSVVTWYPKRSRGEGLA